MALPMLTQDDLADMRDAMDESLPDLADVQRKVMVDDGQGGATETWPAALTDLPCRVSPIPAWRSSENTAGAALISTTGWFITLPANTTIYAADRIEVTNQETAEVRIFEVSGLMDPRSYQIATRVLCSEMI